MTTNPHRVEILPDADWTGRMVCDAPEGAPCRMHCDICEEYLEDDHDTHALRDQGYCIKVEGWFDGDLEDCYDGADRGRLERLHSGPVLITWNGDWMVWQYDESPNHTGPDGKHDPACIVHPMDRDLMDRGQ